MRVFTRTPSMYAPLPASATVIRSSTTSRIQAAAGSPSRSNATMTANGVLPAAKLLVPSTGSTIHTAPRSLTPSITDGWAATASSPTTTEPGSSAVRPAVSARSAA